MINKIIYKDDNRTIEANFKEYITAVDMVACVDSAVATFLNMEHNSRYMTELQDAALLAATLSLLSDYESETFLDDCVLFYSDEYVIDNVMCSLYGENWDAIRHAYHKHIDRVVYKPSYDGFFESLTALNKELKEKVLTPENLATINMLLKMAGEAGGIG